jgi:peptidoglycan/LPS O-acetylase OafA/YrhL
MAKELVLTMLILWVMWAMLYGMLTLAFGPQTRGDWLLFFGTYAALPGALFLAYASVWHRFPPRWLATASVFLAILACVAPVVV